MRKRRFKEMGEKGASEIFHCMTRTVNGERLFGGAEKEALRALIRKAADFSGVEVLTYSVLSNHFHVLVRIPEAAEVDDAELLRRHRALYGETGGRYWRSPGEVERILDEDGEEAERLRAAMRARMGDVSEFMKTVKQRFSMWYNRRVERYGTLWAERFKSVLVEDSGAALRTMAAYIDLNGVRAGLAGAPEEYRWCGYAEAVAGSELARSGLARVWGRGAADWREALREHRLLLFGKGSGPWTAKGAVLDRERAARVMERENGVLPVAAALRCRVRYFTDGAVLGSAEFVRGLAGRWADAAGRRRPAEARPLRGADWEGLSVVKGFRGRLFF